MSLPQTSVHPAGWHYRASVLVRHSSQRHVSAGQIFRVFSTTQTDAHAAEIAELIAPQGRFGLIDHLADANLFMRKSVSIHWELMFTRPIFGTADMTAQGELLKEVSRLVDAGTLRTTMTERMTPIDAANLRRAHKTSESGTAKGKIVLESI